MELKLPYGLREDQLLSIDQVDSGLSCNCICPACEKPLVARKGKIKVHHFAHYESPDCGGGLETALHIKCKNILAQSSTFTTPILYYPNTYCEIFEEKDISVDSVLLEKKLGDIIPDIVIESKGKTLLIEVVVNNPVNWRKLQKIRDRNLATIVIDAKHLFRSLYMKKDFGLYDQGFMKELISGTQYKKWLHNPKLTGIQQKLKNDHAEIKKVEFFKTQQLDYYNYVHACPLSRSIWKGGRNMGKSYASIDKDCTHCKFCLGIDYQNIPHKESLDFTYSIPKKVYCLGEKGRDLASLLRVQP